MNDMFFICMYMVFIYLYNQIYSQSVSAYHIKIKLITPNNNSQQP